MADDRIIADVSKHLLERVRAAVYPSLLKAQEQVALCAPDQKDTEAIVGIHLYSIRDFSAYIPQASPGKPPPLAITLGYLIYLNIGAQSPVDLLTEHHLLGRVIHAIQQNPRIDIAAIHAGAGVWDEPASLTFQKLDDHQKQQLWTGFSQPMQAAVFLDAGPLVIGSLYQATPVTQITGGVRQR